jgi:hypothetical protein
LLIELLSILYKTITKVDAEEPKLRAAIATEEILSDM